MSNNYIIPPIGTKGKFEFKEPFNKNSNKQEFSVHAIRSIQELIDSELNPLEYIYKPVNLTETDMEKDREAGVPIIVLSSGTNEYFYVPANKLSSLPNISGHKYQQRMIAINIGHLPLDYNLDSIKEVIKDSVMENMGISSTVEVIATSAISYVTDEEHNKFMKLLDGRKTNNQSYKTRYKILLETYNKLVAKVKQIENCIVTTRTGTN